VAVWGRRRRERQAFEQHLAEEVARVGALYEQVAVETRQLASALRIRGRRIPGMRFSCRHCGGSLRLMKERWGRGQTQWSSSWICTECGRPHPAELVRQSFEEEVIGSPD